VIAYPQQMPTLASVDDSVSNENETIFDFILVTRQTFDGIKRHQITLVKRIKSDKTRAFEKRKFHRLIGRLMAGTTSSIQNKIVT